MRRSLLIFLIGCAGRGAAPEAVSSEAPPADPPAEAPDHAADCAAGDGEACLHSGEMERACDLGHPFGCYQHGTRLLWSQVPDSVEQGMQILGACCPLEDAPLEDAESLLEGADGFTRVGHAECCMSLGNGYEQGMSVPVDNVYAYAIYERACAVGSAQSCFQLGYFSKVGLDRPVDLDVAIGWFERSCEMGSGSGCHHLGVACERGEGAPQDIERAEALYTKACGTLWSWGDMSGEEIDALYASGEELPPFCADAARLRAEGEAAQPAQ